MSRSLLENGGGVGGETPVTFGRPGVLPRGGCLCVGTLVFVFLAVPPLKVRDQVLGGFV